MKAIAIEQNILVNLISTELWLAIDTYSWHKYRAIHFNQ